MAGLMERLPPTRHLDWSFWERILSGSIWSSGATDIRWCSISCWYVQESGSSPMFTETQLIERTTRSRSYVFFRGPPDSLSQTHCIYVREDVDRHGYRCAAFWLSNIHIGNRTKEAERVLTGYLRIRSGKCSTVGEQIRESSDYAIVNRSFSLNLCRFRWSVKSRTISLQGTTSRSLPRILYILRI